MLEKLHPVNVLIYSFSNGNVFEGFYDKGVQKGSGSLKYANGTRRDGEWKGGQLHGFAFFHYNGSDSPTVERWNNGVKLISKSRLGQAQVDKSKIGMNSRK